MTRLPRFVIFGHDLAYHVILAERLNCNPNERQYSVLTHFTNVYLKHKIIIYKNTKLPTMPPPPTRTWDDQDHVRLLRKLLT